MCLIAAIINCPEKDPEQCVITRRNTHGSWHCSISRRSKSSGLGVFSLRAWQTLLLVLSPCRTAMKESETVPAPETG